MTRSLQNSTPFEGLCDKDRDVWCLGNKQLFTTDWVDEEGDPYPVSPQLALEAALRLYQLKKDSELLIHASPCIPECPIMACAGEDKSIHQRVGGLWRKLYCANGHTFQSKRFSRCAHCTVCTDCIGGLGHQVYKCVNCKLLVHKKCHKLVTVECGQPSLPSEPMMPVDQSSVASDAAQIIIPHHLSSHEGLEQVDEESEAVNNRETGKASPSLGLQDFDMLRVIGRGGYGKVLLVQLKNSDRIYAVKAVKKELVDIDWVQTEKRVLEQA
ncbi:Protein kinase C iota type [Heterocephalus glaber]|uniref:non-specific serine/threonine protein kinase n=1 Tax=Heterocephalus glaber TaxID=10181 RepID=G5B2B4_HETGA|nr:Protein kinase C iota type [Heterocephalus glaber]